jgi:NADH:ubiquinone oxidoreductase subunit 6 (subunit J)
MMGVAIAIGALLLVSVMTSTKEGRAEVRARTKPYEKWALLAVVVIWGVMILGWLLPGKMNALSP